MLHVWNIYLQNCAIFGVNVGIYSSTMEHLGMEKLFQWFFLRLSEGWPRPSGPGEKCEKFKNVAEIPNKNVEKRGRFLRVKIMDNW